MVHHKRPHPLGCTGGEVRQHQRERAHEHARQLVDDRDLLENGAHVVEGRQEGHVPVADARRVLHEKVGEAVREVPAAVEMGFQMRGWY